MNIIACQFVYVNAVAVYAAREKIWRVSLNAEQSLPPPAVALYQLTGFPKRAILANNDTLLESNYRDKINDQSNWQNQASFTAFSSFPAKGSRGIVDPGQLNYVTFNGSYRKLKTLDDLDLSFSYYCECI